MKKINIAELLKNCPTGMELDCTMYDSVTLLSVDDREDINFPIKVVRKDGYAMVLTKYGQYTKADFAKCIIFPKGKITWDGFIPPFKDGDIITCTNSICTFVAIYKCMCDKNSFYRYACLILNGWSMNGKMHFKPDTDQSDFANPRFATEEERQKLFEAIKENGYQWNAETKTLQKVIESKEDTDDRIVMSGIYFDRENYADEVELHLNNYEIEIRDGKTYAIFKNQETKTLEKLINKNKFIVGTTITNGKIISKIVSRDVDSYKLENGTYVFFNEVHNWELVHDKFDITTLKPFDRVLVRDTNENCWHTDFYSHYTGTYFYTANGLYAQCVPYEGNEHLLGTADDCDEYYKTWE